MDNKESLRRYDIDWLRNFAILLLFPFHSARVFDHWDPFYVKNETLSWGLSWFISVANLWFMPLLFWLAGSASWYALRVKSTSFFLKERSNRLLIPLLFGVLFIVPPQGYFAILDHTGKTAGSYFMFFKNFFTDFSDLSGYFGTFTPAHLWFILYLFVLSVAALPVFTFLNNQKRKDFVNKFHKIFSHPFIFIFLFIVLTIAQALPAPGGQNPFFYLAILLIGYISCSDPSYQEMFNRYRFKALIMVLILVPIWAVLVAHNQGAKDFSAISIFLTFFRSLNTLLGLIVILGFGNKILNFRHKILSYLNEAAFPIYIIHQSVLVVIGYYVIRLDMSVSAKFILIMLSTLVASLLIFELIIKRTGMTRYLFGVKTKKASPLLKQKQNKTV
ncbi:acyltransferase family protein [Neobacillus novalis]|uniref:Acyltransferase family protein n=1 Tax=Neobacillus novalis TaxID=220687 RepID=A0AA95MHU2_9BACI|nr:acyltransferase family protein [Neobacillus novalis]WHY83870.1 acyltransferase family protein [Neobacillus novalis]